MMFLVRGMADFYSSKFKGHQILQFTPLAGGTVRRHGHSAYGGQIISQFEETLKVNWKVAAFSPLLF
jgi:hypothetical protein